MYLVCIVPLQLLVLIFMCMLSEDGDATLLIRDVPTCPDFRLYCDMVIDGSGYKEAKLNEVSSFTVVIGHRDLTNQEFPKTIPLMPNGTVLQARLIGTSIVAAEVEEMALVKDSVGVYKATYQLKDPGEYRLQIRLVWLSGASNRHDPFINEREFDMKSKYIDCTIYNESIVVVGTVDPMLHAPKPLCTGGSHPGRWIDVEAFGSMCKEWMCVGSKEEMKFIFDLFSFNEKYVWVPWDCVYKFYSVVQLEQCLIQDNITTIHIAGDSLAKEHYLNIVSFLTNNGATMQKVLQYMQFILPLTTKPSTSVNVVFDPDDNIGVFDNSWFIWNVQLMHALSSGNEHTGALFRYKVLHHEIGAGGKKRKRVYYNHPQIQREDPRVVRDKQPREAYTRVSPFAYMTPPRQRIQANDIVNLAMEMHEPLLDALLPSKGRWESSWDGIHYCMASRGNQILPNATCNQWRRGGRNMCHQVKTLPGINRCGDDGYMYWCKAYYDASTGFSSFEGGVSKMLTMIWINMMCNGMITGR